LVVIKVDTFSKLLKRLYGDQVKSQILDWIAVQLKENQTPKVWLFRLRIRVCKDQWRLNGRNDFC
jgi:DNA-directed RNA polymerase specialized sigma24 family protein